jgi:hypothetical protein
VLHAMCAEGGGLSFLLIVSLILFLFLFYSDELYASVVRTAMCNDGVALTTLR